MNEAEKDFYLLAAWMLTLCLASMLLARKVRALDDNVRYLMDNSVTRETEPRP